jgi:hypothetical protein
MAYVEGHYAVASWRACCRSYTCTGRLRALQGPGPRENFPWQ